jgi:predicted ThiF/HesA family dinucleotide-utilizing enzyme
LDELFFEELFLVAINFLLMHARAGMVGDKLGEAKVRLVRRLFRVRSQSEVEAVASREESQRSNHEIGKLDANLCESRSLREIKQTGASEHHSVNAGRQNSPLL